MKRAYILYDDRGPDDGSVIEYVGDFGADETPIKMCKKDWGCGVLYSYRIKDDTLIDETFVMHITADES